MTIFNDNEGKRFIDAGDHGWGPSDPNHYLIIKDFSWWIQNERDIYSWMEINLPKGRMHHEGMVISMPTREQITVFLLTWG